MIQLYDFQEKLGLETRASLRKNKSSLVVLPTGGGKSFITAWMVKNILAKGNTAYCADMFNPNACPKAGSYPGPGCFDRGRGSFFMQSYILRHHRYIQKTRGVCYRENCDPVENVRGRSGPTLRFDGDGAVC